MIRRAGLLGSLVAVSFLLVLVAAVQGLPLLAAAGSLGIYLGLHLLLRQLQTRPVERLGGLLAALSGVLACEQALVLVLVLGDAGTDRRSDVAAVVTVVVLAALRLAWSALQLADGQLRRDRILVRNLGVPDEQLFGDSRLLSGRGLPVSAWPGLVLSMGAAAGVAASSSSTLLVACALAALAALVLLLLPLPRLLALVRAPRGTAHRDLVRAALRPHAPVVVLYFGGGPGSVYAANTWLPTLERVRQSAFVMLRDPAALARLAPTTLPVVCAPGRRDVFSFAQAPLQVSLFPVNETENLRLLRSRELRSAFVGHGDSDKSGSASTLSRAYDEVWVAGPAGRQRYTEADVGVRDEQIREVGRPQTAQVQLPSSRRPAGGPYTVLYAPTWEGLDLANHESSLQVAGPTIVSQLLGLEDVRIVYRPHPLTGSRRADVARTHRGIVARLRAAGAPHQVQEGDGVDLFACFDEADALVTDISSVIPDFLASTKPYFVVDVRSLAEEEFRRDVPTAAAAYVVQPTGEGLLDGLADARGADSMRARRLALREHLIGPLTDDPYGRFSQALDELGGLRRSRPRGSG